jgi:hydroxypyruvate isomerase
VRIPDADLTCKLLGHPPLIGHVQIATVLSRAESDSEVNYASVLGHLDASGMVLYRTRVQAAEPR